VHPALDELEVAGVFDLERLIGSSDAHDIEAELECVRSDERVEVRGRGFCGREHGARTSDRAPLLGAPRDQIA
jgi:hypothetical protein